MNNPCLFWKKFLFGIVVLFVAYFFSIVSSSVHAESSPKYLGEQEKMLGLIDDVYAQFNQLPYDNKDLSTISKLFSGACDAFPTESYQRLALLADAERFDRDWGFELRGRYSRVIEGTRRGSNSSLDDGIIAPPGFVELSWDILRHGFLENRGRAQTLRNEAQLAKLDNQFENVVNGYRCSRYKLAQNFAGHTSQILTLRLLLMKSIASVEKRAYFKGWSQFEEFLVSEEELLRIKHELSYIHSSPHFDGQVTNLFYAPLIDIDMQQIAAAIRDDNLPVQINSLKKEVLESREKARFNNQLRFFVREGLIRDDRFEDSTRVGLSFNIPLTIKKDDALQYRLLEVEREKEHQSWERLTKVRYAYSLVRNQQKQTIKQHYRFQRALDRFRNSQVSLRLDFDDDNDLIIALTRLRTLLDAAFELNEVKKELYWRIHEVFLISGVEYQPNFIFPYDLPTEHKRRRPWERSIYAWSNTFNSYSNSDILDFLQVKGINKITLSASKKTNKEKMASFIQHAPKYEIDVEVMFSTNEWVHPENHQHAAMSVLMLAEQQEAVHLDIEPHTFPDFKQRQEYYLENYIAMLSAIRLKIPTSRLTVAVPLHWPMEYYEKTLQLVDGIYFMAYGPKPETLIRRLHPITKQLDQDKITVVIRIKDTEDEWELEQRINEINQYLGIRRFGFENLSSFFTLASQ
ncbi:MAG: hypothetical protein K0U40_10000 [Betaproteobacteria bacterium]|nr:hypothetical protein [Betaproteobacteria bacterium]